MKEKNNDEKLADIVANNDELETLKALQLKVARTLDNTTSARDIGTLAKQLREITERITFLGGSTPHDDDISTILEERLSIGKLGNIR